MSRLLPCLMIVLLARLACAGPVVKILSAAGLHEGFRANRILLAEMPPSVTLDTRNLKADFRGEIETDAIDLLDPDNLSAPGRGKLVKVTVTTDAVVPAGAAITLFVKSGPTYFSEAGWSAWEKASGLVHETVKLKGPYLKIRYALSATAAASLPLIRQAELKAEFEPAPVFQKPAAVLSFDNTRIIRSPVEFSYESRDNPAVKEFTARNGLVKLAQSQENEVAALLALNDWVARCRNDRHGMWETNYPWNIRELSSDSQGSCVIRGHCMSYAAVLITALSGTGYYARHWAVNGFRDADHEVVEVWSNQLKKWIYLDPSLDQHYQDPRTKTPLSILEMHNILVNTFFKPGEDLNMPMDEQKKRVKGMGGGKLAPILCVDKGFHYGAAAPADYDWGWYHGYMADGFMRMTTRNDFHSKKEPWFPHFGEGIGGWDVFLSWVDEKTPPKSDIITRISGRERDFYWTLNQASIKAFRKSEEVVSVEFGNSQPFFKRYKVSIDDNPAIEAPARYDWVLHEGDNILMVTPEDKWGTPGLASVMKIRL